MLLIGLLSLIEYGLQMNFGIDQTFFIDHSPLAAPGRTAVNFEVAGAALILLVVALSQAVHLADCHRAG